MKQADTTRPVWRLTDEAWVEPGEEYVTPSWVAPGQTLVWCDSVSDPNGARRQWRDLVVARAAEFDARVGSGDGSSIPQARVRGIEDRFTEYEKSGALVFHGVDEMHIHNALLLLHTDFGDGYPVWTGASFTSQMLDPILTLQLVEKLMREIRADIRDGRIKMFD